MAAVVAAPGGDDLLHVEHGAAVAHQPWMVLQPELLLAWAHAYAGNYHQQQPHVNAVIWACAMLCTAAAQYGMLFMLSQHQTTQKFADKLV